MTRRSDMAALQRALHASAVERVLRGVCDDLATTTDTWRLTYVTACREALALAADIGEWHRQADDAMINVSTSELYQLDDALEDMLRRVAYTRDQWQHWQRSAEAETDKYQIAAREAREARDQYRRIVTDRAAAADLPPYVDMLAIVDAIAGIIAPEARHDR
jgi:hypothetical protein